MNLQRLRQYAPQTLLCQTEESAHGRTPAQEAVGSSPCLSCCSRAKPSEACPGLPPGSHNAHIARVGPRRKEPEASRTGSVLNWLEKRLRTYLRGSSPAPMGRKNPEDQTSELIIQGFWPIMVYPSHSHGGSGATMKPRAAACDRLLWHQRAFMLDRDSGAQRL